MNRNLNRLVLLFESRYSVLLLLFSVGGAILLAAQFSSVSILITVASVSGGILALYEIHYARRIAESGFIRDLNTTFTSDEAISELWRRLLLSESITNDHRINISSYFTFFETLYLLMKRGVLRHEMIDDLFRNRFFTAIGNEDIQNIALISNREAFRNVYALTTSWADYLRVKGIPPHPGYQKYLLASTEAAGFQIIQIGSVSLDKLLALQHRVISSIENSSWLRANDEQTLLACLTDHYCLGAVRPNGELVAVAIMYDGGVGDECIIRHITKDVIRQEASANIKLVLVDPKYRRAGLGRSLVEAIEIYAIEKGKHELACTVHSRNRASRHLFESLGFRRIKRVNTTYGSRQIYTRKIPTKRNSLSNS